MPDDKRKDDRAPVGLRVRLRYADLAAFVASPTAQLSRSSVVLEGVAARDVGTQVRFELQLGDGSVALRGEGKVVGSLSGDRGLRVRFSKLDSRSKSLLDTLPGQDRVPPSMMPPPEDATDPTPAVRPATAPSRGEHDSMLSSLEAAIPTRFRTQPRAAERIDLASVDALLSSLEASVPARTARPTPTTPAVAAASAPPATAARNDATILEQIPPGGFGPVAPLRSLRPDDLHGMPAVLGSIVGEDGVEQPVLEPPAEAATPPRLSNAPEAEIASEVDIPISTAPLAMQEPEPEPPSMFPDDADAALASLEHRDVPRGDPSHPHPAQPLLSAAIPQAPRMPRMDINPAPMVDEPLPDLDLDEVLGDRDSALVPSKPSVGPGTGAQRVAPTPRATPKRAGPQRR